LLTAVVVGLGRIGSRDDAKRPDPPRSHIGAALAAGRFRLMGLVDPDPEARDQARAQWPELGDAKIVARLDELGPVRPDLVALATPTATREADIAAALMLRPRLLLIEKPLGPDLAQARTIVRALESIGQTARVVYMRRFAPGIAAALDAFEGPPLKVIVGYANGIAANCSHALDLVRARYGTAVRARASTPSDETADADPDVDFHLRFARGFDLYAVALPGRAFAHLDMTFFFPRGRVELLASGTRIRVDAVTPGAVFPGYSHLGPVEAPFRIDPRLGMVDLYRAAAAHLADGAPLGGASPREALDTIAALDAVHASRRANGAPQEIPADPMAGA
jgi:predicted dehydrogenase